MHMLSHKCKPASVYFQPQGRQNIVLSIRQLITRLGGA